MNNQIKFIQLVANTMAARGVTAYQLCKNLGISRGNFSRWINGHVDSRNGKNKPATMRGEYVIEIMYYLNLLK